MKYTLGLVLLCLFSCQTNTYTTAQNQNSQRFEGAERKNAEYLLKAKDLVLLTQKLSELAMGEAELRNTYLLAEDTYNIAMELNEKFRTESQTNQIALSDNLSANNAQYLQEMREMPEEEFDKTYYQLMTSRLYDIIELSEDYLKYGQNEGLLDFAEKLKTQMTSLRKRFEQTDTL